MRCPNCGSENCHYISSVSRSTSGFGFSRACCGTLLSGPVLGILCGLCGAGKTTESVSEYWVCDSCGRKFTQWEAENANRYRIEKFAFYAEAQAQSVVEPFKTEMGERVMNAYAQYIKDVLPKDNAVISNPPIEMKTLEDLKSVVGKVLNEKELVYMVFPTERLVVADKGLIIGNQNHGIPKEILHYKNYIYIGQSYITATSEEEARAIQRFLRKVYLNDDSVDVSDESYIGVLSRLQKLDPEKSSIGVLSRLQKLDPEKSSIGVLSRLLKLDPEKSSQGEHYSSQKEYEKYVKLVQNKVLGKLKNDDPDRYLQYLKKNKDTTDVSDLWKGIYIIAGIVMFFIKLFTVGFIMGVVAALVVILPGSLIRKILYGSRHKEMLSLLPDQVSRVIQENEKDSQKKTGNINVLEYETYLNESLEDEFESWTETDIPTEEATEAVFDPEEDKRKKTEKIVLTIILVVVFLFAFQFK